MKEYTMNVAKQLKAEHFPKLMGDKFDSPRLHEHHIQIHIIENYKIYPKY